MIYKDFLMSFRGRCEWKRIKKKYGVKDGVLVLLMPESNEKINYYALKHLDYYRKKKYMDKVIILTDQIKVQTLWEKNPITQTCMVPLETEQCKALQKYYQLQEFYSDFVMVSVSQPDGNTVGNMLKSQKVTEEELILGSIYI